VLPEIQTGLFNDRQTVRQAGLLLAISSKVGVFPILVFTLHNAL
jgi:hypothetical protein